MPTLSARLATVSALVALVGVGVGAGACSSDTSSRDAHTLVTRGALLLDVRSRSEFAERHIAGAVNIPVEELPKRMSEVGATDREVVVYCHTGARAGVAAILLRKAGYQRVHNLGGIAHWSTEHDDWQALQ